MLSTIISSYHAIDTMLFNNLRRCRFRGEVYGDLLHGTTAWYGRDLLRETCSIVRVDACGGPGGICMSSRRKTKSQVKWRIYITRSRGKRQAAYCCASYVLSYTKNYHSPKNTYTSKYIFLPKLYHTHLPKAEA